MKVESLTMNIPKDILKALNIINLNGRHERSRKNESSKRNVAYHIYENLRPVGALLRHLQDDAGSGTTHQVAAARMNRMKNVIG